SLFVALFDVQPNPGSGNILCVNGVCSGLLVGLV
ncbi:MAG: hypothetical protein ACI9B8_001720, partial [Sulfitobacter sp.]